MRIIKAPWYEETENYRKKLTQTYFPKEVTNLIMAPNSQFGAVVSYSKSCCSRSACCAARRSSRFCFIVSTAFKQELGFFFTAAEIQLQHNALSALTMLDMALGKAANLLK